jgi:hypothetical protein
MVVGAYSTSNFIPPDFGFLRFPDGGIVTFNVPDSDFIEPWAINDRGEITGFYYFDNDDQVGGFIRAPDGSITTFHYQQGIIPLSINRSGCRAALKTENVGNGVGLLHLNRIRAQAPCT